MKEKLQNDIVKEIARILRIGLEPGRVKFQELTPLVDLNEVGKKFNWHKGIRYMNISQLQEFLVELRKIV